MNAARQGAAGSAYPMWKLVLTSCLCLLWLSPRPAPAATPPPTVQGVWDDLRTHGYPSLSVAISRLQGASDVPGATASLAQRHAYYSKLLQLADSGRHEALAKASVAALQHMAERENCAPCRFDLLLHRAASVRGSQSAAAAEPFLQQAQAMVGSLHDDEATQRLLAARAATAEMAGRHNVAIELALKASAMAHARGTAAEELTLLVSMIGMNADLGDPKRAIALGNEARSRARAMGFLPILSQIHLDMGHAWSLLGDRPNQRHALERALALAESDPDLLDIKEISLNNLSDYYLSQSGQSRLALDYAQRADDLARSMQTEQTRPPPLANIGLALAQLGDAQGGIAKLHEAMDIAQRHGQTTYIIGIADALVDVLQGEGRYREALETLQQANTLRANVTAQEREKALLDLQEKYASERKAQEITRLSTENALSQAKLEALSLRRSVWGLLAVAMAFGLVLLGLVIRRIYRANRRLAGSNVELAWQSTIDPLTGVFNRRHAPALFDPIQRASPDRHDMASGHAGTAGTGILMLDLDAFKRVNDTWGHAAGDAVLVAVAQRLRALLREGDAVVRWGGEEFVLVLPQTKPGTLSIVARKVLNAIGGAPIAAGTPAVALSVTVSIGAACFTAQPGQTWQAAVALADRLLYQAKAAGRNRAVCVRRTAAGLDPAQVLNDLQAAQASGDLELVTVCGPTTAPLAPMPLPA